MKAALAMSALVVLATATTHAQAQLTGDDAVIAPQLCHDDFMCRLLGGSCVRGASSSLKCGKEFLFNRFCGESDDCSCCVRASCDQTRWCAWYGGKCMGKRECPADHRWVSRLCGSNPFMPSRHCGCCIPIKPPTQSPTTSKPTSSPSRSPTRKPTPAPTGCQQTDHCKVHGGKCTAIEECTLPNWDPTLCDFDGTSAPTGERCGCCFGQSDPCPQSDVCKLAGGFCTDSPSTACPAGSEPNPDLCEGPNCSCCVPSTPRPTPFSCEQSSTCVAIGGFCTTDATTCPADHKLDSGICTGQECMCCHPGQSTPTKSPTPGLCGPSDKCTLRDGFCSREPECPSGMVRDRTLCEGTDENCACCIPSQSTPTKSPTPGLCGPSEKCSLRNGFCSREPECPSGMLRDRTLCEGTDENCACCIPEGQ